MAGSPTEDLQCIECGAKKPDVDSLSLMCWDCWRRWCGEPRSGSSLASTRGGRFRSIDRSARRREFRKSNGLTTF